MNIEHARALLLARSRPMEDFKLENLSLNAERRPIMELGAVNVGFVAKTVRDKNLMQSSPSISPGFVNMSELWMFGDFSSRQKTPIEIMCSPIMAKVRAVTSDLLGKPTKIFKAVIDTIDDSTCILPHCDNYFHHGLALRVHAPLFTSPGSVGISWHPNTLESQIWRMEVSKLYAINNFEPHTVLKLDPGQRAHLIMDVVLADLLDDFKGSEIAIAQEALMGFKESHLYGSSNLFLRNRLGAKYGAMKPVHSFQDQEAPEYIEQTRQWMAELVRKHNGT